MAWWPARIAAAVQTRKRMELFEAYGRASYPAQVREREGSLVELSGGHTVRVGDAVIHALMGLGAVVVLIAMLAAAFVTSPVGALAVVGVGLGLFGVLRPVSAAVRRSHQQLADANLDFAGELAETVRLAEEARVFGVDGARIAAIRRLSAGIQGHLFRTHFVA
ncbi:MAG: hypothetical protein C4321_01960, partial [Chloroflexota bacterium]